MRLRLRWTIFWSRNHSMQLLGEIVRKPPSRFMEYLFSENAVGKGGWQWELTTTCTEQANPYNLHSIPLVLLIFICWYHFTLYLLSCHYFKRNNNKIIVVWLSPESRNYRGQANSSCTENMFSTHHQQQRPIFFIHQSHHKLWAELPMWYTQSRQQ